MKKILDDLHRAIQDFMGWLDYHLYTFLPNGDHRRGKKALEIGILSEDGHEYNEMVDYDARKTRYHCFGSIIHNSTIVKAN